jgi:hypothetical protein
LPARLIHQNEIGKWLWPSRSVDHHWTTKRLLQIPWPSTLQTSQKPESLSPWRACSTAAPTSTDASPTAPTQRSTGCMRRSRSPRYATHRLRA